MYSVNMQVLEKVGKAEETVDISFNQERERFFNHYKAVKALRKNVIKYLEVARGTKGFAEKN